MGNVGASQEAYITNASLTTRIQDGVARLDRFDWTSGFAKIWWPEEFIGSSDTKRTVTSFGDRQPWGSTTVTTSSIRSITI